MGRLAKIRSPGRTRQLSAAIFVVALFVRLVSSGLYVTPDEPIWVLRSTRLLAALRSGDLAAMPQTGHPGLTTMALGAFGTWVMTLLFPVQAAAHLDWISHIVDLAPENSAAFPHLVFFLPAARVAVAVVASAGLVLAYLIGRKGLGERAARLLALFLALDPFFSGYAGLLHTDALQATFVLLAVLVAMPPRKGARTLGFQFLSLTGAALFLALAGLTKMLGLLAAPGLAVAVLALWRGTWWQRLARAGLLTVLTVAFLVALYPPAWIDAPAAIRALVAAVSYHEGIGLRPVFFVGETSTNPGPWFYPVVLLFRLTPPVLLGLIVLAVRPWRGTGTGRATSLKAAGWWALLPAVSYIGALTIVDKKFDRYVLTVVPLLTVLAALGWQRLGRRADQNRRVHLAVLALLLLPWAWVAVVPLQYADPLLGGPPVAQAIVPLGWGEGSGLAAHKVNRLVSAAEASTSTLMTRNVPGTAGIFEGQTWPWVDEQVGCTDWLIGSDAPEGYGWLADVWAAGRRQTTIYERTSVVEHSSLPAIVAPGPLPGVPAEAVPPVADTAHLQAWLDARLEADGAFVWLHAPECYPLVETQLRAVLDDAVAAGSIVCEPGDPILDLPSERCARMSSGMPTVAPYLARFAGAVDMISATWPNQVQGPDPLTVRLRWEPRAILGELDVYLALRDEASEDDVVWTEGGRRALSDWDWPAPAWPVGEITDGEAYVSIPLSLPPGVYRLVLRLAGPTGWLGYTRPDGTFGGLEVDLGEVTVQPASYPAPGLDLAAESEIDWPGLRVTGYDPPAEQLQAGRRMHFALGLERHEGAVPTALAWNLVCEGELSGVDVLPWPVGDPSNWPVGHRYVVQFAPRVSPTRSAASCAIYVQPAGEAGVPADGRALYLHVGDVAIEQRAHTFELSTSPEMTSTVTVGDLARLIGIDLPTHEMQPGSVAATTLYWRVVSEAERDYTVFVHAVGPDGQVWGQSDAWPGGGSAPTMTWVPGEVVVDAHTFTLNEGAPTGTYDLVVGLYDADSGVRLPLYEGGVRLPGDQAQIGAFVVGP